MKRRKHSVAPSYHSQERADALQARLNPHKVEPDFQARLERARWQRAQQALIDSRPREVHFETIVVETKDAE